LTYTPLFDVIIINDTLEHALQEAEICINNFLFRADTQRLIN